MNIYEIKRLTQETSPHYFTRESMKFFGQTLKDFSVHKCEDGRFLISAPRYYDGKIIGYSKRFFNPKNNKLEIN